MTPFHRCGTSSRNLILALALVLLALPATAQDGLRFDCPPEQIETIETAMEAYLQSLDITPPLIVKEIERERGRLTYTLATPPGDTDTLSLHQRPGFRISRETVSLTRRGKSRQVVTVSKKEILLALMQHGRLTEFAGSACSLEALREHVGLRQNIVAWAENLNWNWPNGGTARWNKRYWDKGTPLPRVSVATALQNAFDQQGKYTLGCYTTTKLAVAQGIVQFFERSTAPPGRAALIEARLLADGDPLVNIEPPRMWSFETDFDPADAAQPGKLVKLIAGVAPGNFVPGDWIYLLNTDPGSSKNIGYEGSNTLYLGRNRFVDYFNDNRHGYTYQEKLDEVYQWRNGVFSRARDFRKIRRLSAQDYARLGKLPRDGGLLLDLRAVPYFFGHEALP